MNGICPISPERIPQAAQIERESFAVGHAWSEESIRTTLDSPSAIGLCILAENGEMTACALGTALLGEGEILHIATKPEYRGMGYGFALLCAVLDAMRGGGTETVFLEVRESHAPAIGLYEKCGFTISGRRKRYYRDPTEDAVLMAKSLEMPAHIGQMR